MGRASLDFVITNIKQLEEINEGKLPSIERIKYKLYIYTKNLLQ